MYYVTFTTQRGGSGMESTPNIERVKQILKRQYKIRKHAQVKNATGDIVGKCWEDDSQRIGWNWYMEE